MTSLLRQPPETRRAIALGVVAVCMGLVLSGAADSYIAVLSAVMGLTLGYLLGG